MPAKLRTLPLKYWGLHPLFSCDVRLLAVHLSRCVRSADARRGDGAHLLYDVHPISRAEAAGVVVAARRSGDRLTLAIDDGTGTIQASIFLVHWDGCATHHYQPCVGDAVVVAGRLAFGWQLGVASGRVRELQVRSIRLVATEDELCAHWLETLALHAKVYCRPTAELLAPGLPADAPALLRMSPMSPAGLALRARASPTLEPVLAEATTAITGSREPEEVDDAVEAGNDDGDDDGDDVDEAWFTGLMLRIVRELHPHCLQDVAETTLSAAPPLQAPWQPPRVSSLDPMQESSGSTSDLPSAVELPKAPSPPTPLPLPTLSEHFSARHLLSSCQAHDSWNRIIGFEAGSQLFWALEDGCGDSSTLLARVARALVSLERSGEVFRLNAVDASSTAESNGQETELNLLQPPLRTPAPDDLFCVVSTSHTILPALRALLATEPPSRRSKRAAAPAAADDVNATAPALRGFKSWPLADIARALSAQPATRYVPTRRLRDALQLMLIRGEVCEAERNCFVLEDL